MFFRALPMTEDDNKTSCVVFAVWSEQHEPELLAMLLGSIPSYIISDFSPFPPGSRGFIGAVFPEDFKEVTTVLEQLDFENKTPLEVLKQIDSEVGEFFAIADRYREHAKPRINEDVDPWV